jgi:hypothetical protein
MFHDESTRVVSQHQSRRGSSSAIPNTQTGSKAVVKRASTQIGSTTPFKFTGFVMYQPLDDLGANFFMSNFVVPDPAMSLLHYLPGFYAKTGFANSALSQMVTAVGLVGLANRSRSNDMRNVAANNYGAAIRSINAAFLNPKYAAQDSILASIYLAAMFEALIMGRNVGMDNACMHFAGAVSVGRLILKQEKQTDVTLKQCTTLVKTVIMNCWIQQVSLPPDFVKFKKLVEQKVNVYSIYDKFLDTVMEFVQFKEELRDEPKSNATDLIQRTLAIDITLKNFARSLECQYPFEAIRILNSKARKLVYEGYFHSTSSPLSGVTSRLANFHCKFTLSLLELICGTTFDLPGSTSIKSFSANAKVSLPRHNSSLNEKRLTRSSLRRPKK